MGDLTKWPAAIHTLIEERERHLSGGLAVLSLSDKHGGTDFKSDPFL